MPEIREKRKPRLQDGVFTLYCVSRCRSLKSKAEVRTRQHGGFFMCKIQFHLCREGEE